jgi:tetratricopeptide (TPR) repeat protein
MPPRERSGFTSRIAVILVSVAVLSACGGAQGRKARHLENGQAFLAAGNYEKARVEFRNALQIAPNDPEARFENAVVDEKLENFREAAQFYQGTIDVSPQHLKARVALAKLHLFSSLPDKALEYIKPVLAGNPDNSELLTIRAAAKVQQKDISGALADAERAVQLDPTNEDAVGALAGIYNSNDTPAKAVALLSDSIKKMPGTIDLRLALAQLYASENRQGESEQLLIDLVRLRPNEKAHRIRLAQFYARADQVDAAERVLREGIAAIPTNQEMKFALVEFLNSRRSQDVAEKELKSMVNADASNFELKFALGKLYESNKQPEKAEAVYQDVIEKEKLEAAGLSARDRLATLYAQRNDIAGAEKLVGEVLAKSPRDNDALILRGNIALAKKDPKSAIADLRAVLRDQPNAIPVLRTLARAHMANGEPAIAEETMRHALESTPRDPNLRLDLAQLLAQLGKPDQAKPVLADLVKDQPNNVSALDTLFRVSVASKDFTTAKSAADAIVATQPKSALGFMYQGMVAEQQDRNDDALRLYGAAARAQPDQVEPLTSLVHLLVKLKRFDEAIKHIDAVGIRMPNDPIPPNMKGHVLLAQGKFSESQAAFKTASSHATKWWEPYRGIAMSQIAQKNAEGAVATLKSAQAIVTEPLKLGLELAGLLENLGKEDEAISQYESLLKLDPKSDVIANNLSMLLVTYKSDKASLDRAKMLASRFAESTNPSFLDTYGWVLYKRGETSASVPVLERVVAKAPDAPVALYHLGMAQSRAGSSMQARDNLSRAVNSGAKFSGLDEAKATLDKLPASGASDAPKI